MRTLKPVIALMGIALIMIAGISCTQAKKTDTAEQDPTSNLEQAQKEIEVLNKKFSEDFKNADSTALANYYASNGLLGSVKGKENLVAAWGTTIRNAVKDSTPNMLFTTNGLTTDGEYLVELGTYKFADNEDKVKNSGKYVVVWKKENGEWKIYRDVGL